MKRKLKAIWYEIIKKWLLLTFLPSRMEKERMQIIAEIVDKKDTLWKGIPPKSRTLLEILSEKKPQQKVKQKSYNESVLEEYNKKKAEIDKALFEALQEIEKQKQNGNSKETTNNEQEKI
jgi:hypothetical protein